MCSCVHLGTVSQVKGAGSPCKAFLAMEGVGRGSGLAQSVPGQVPKWPGEQPQGLPVPTGSGGVVPWTRQVAFVASVSSPE